MNKRTILIIILISNSISLFSQLDTFIYANGIYKMDENILALSKNKISHLRYFMNFQDSVDIVGYSFSANLIGGEVDISIDGNKIPTEIIKRYLNPNYSTIDRGLLFYNFILYNRYKKNYYTSNRRYIIVSKKGRHIFKKIKQ